MTLLGKSKEKYQRSIIKDSFSKCKFFAELRIVKMAWGFEKLFSDEIDFTKI